MKKKTKIHLVFQVDENGDYIVSDNLSLMYGIGATLLLALHDYSTSLIGYIEIWDKHKSSKEIGDSRGPTELELGNAGGESPRQPDEELQKVQKCTAVHEMKLCEATIQFGDDFGDNETTFHCEQPIGHTGFHCESGKLYGHKYAVTWDGFDGEDS